VPLLACVLLSWDLAAGGAEVRFTEKPAVTTAGTKVTITFAVSAATDVEVAILDAKGKVVRHLAAGVLGAKTAPPPPLKPGLSQSLIWDGKDDFGKPAVGGPFTVRVRAGAGVKLGRFVGAEDPYTFGRIDSTAFDEDGNLYVIAFHEYRGLGNITLRKFDPQGRYLRTLMPFPADLPPGAMKDVAAWDAEAGTFRPRNLRNLNPAFYSKYGGRSGTGLRLVAASKKAGILLTNGHTLYKLNLDGSVAGDKFATRSLWPRRSKVRFGPPQTAVSPDGRSVYLVGMHAAKSRYGHKYNPAYPPGVIYRMPLDGTGGMAKFAAVGVAHEEGVGGEYTKNMGNLAAKYAWGAPLSGLAVGKDGRVYVGDREHQRVAVFNPDGKLAGQINVKCPSLLAVHPTTGAVYVLQKARLGYGKWLMTLFKFDRVGDAKPSITHKLSPVMRTGMSLWTTKGRSLLLLYGLGKGVGGDVTFLTDAGDRFEPAETLYKPKPNAQYGWHRLAVDHDRDEVYGSDGCVGMWRYDGETNKGEFLMRDGKPFWSQDLAVGYDGLIYARLGRGVRVGSDYSGPFGRFTRDLKPAPYKATGTHLLSKYIYSRTGPGYAERGIGVAPDGKVYISWMAMGWVKYAVTGFGADGRPLKGKCLVGQIPEHHRKVAPGGPIDSAVIGPITAGNGGVRVDLDGNIYLGLWVWPKNVPVPNAYERSTPFAATVGTIVKFPPDGGFVTSPRADWSSDPVGSTPRTPGAKGIEARSGSRSGAGKRMVAYPAFIEGALAAYPGLAPFSHANWGANTCCVCRSPRFDLDRYGRLYIPNALTNSVKIVDNAGNVIVTFGKYGNFDSQYVNPNLQKEGEKPQPTVAVPAIPLGWPSGTGASEDHIYVCDTYNRRAVRVDLTHAAEQTCRIK